MFDTIKALFSGFAGDLRESKEARKLVWLLLVTFLAGWLAATFAAWVSFPSYRALIIFLPYATGVAWAFTLAIASFLYFALAYLAGFLVEKWKGIDQAARNYTALGARILGVCAALFLCVDVYMNMQGAGHRAQEAGGKRAALASYETPPAIAAQLADDRKVLADLRAGKIGGYGWKAKDGIYHLNNSGKKYQRSLSASIRRNEQADSTGRAVFIADVSSANQARETLIINAEATLKNGVYGVYVLIFLLCIVQAYIVETIQEATGQNSGPVSAPQRPAKVARVQAPANNKITQQAATTAPVAVNGGWLKVDGGWQITCSNCGQEAIKKHHLAKYCSDECRVEAWENRTGGKVKKGKGKQPRKIGY